MSDPLANDFAQAITRLCNPRDRRFAQSLFDQHRSGKPLSANQMYWAKTLIERSGNAATQTDFGTSVAEDIFADKMPTLSDLAAETAATLTQNERDKPALNATNATEFEKIVERILGTVKADLVEQNDTREANLAARQEAFNKNAAKSIAQACVTEALKQLDARVPRQVIVKVERHDGTQHEVEGLQHPNFAKLLQYCTLRKHDGYVPGIMLAGERGSGKTTGCRNVAQAFGTTWYSNGAISDPIEMLGYKDANGNYHTTPFRQAFEFGGLYTFDEVDRSDPNAVLAVNPHLANNEAAFPDGMVKRHKDCIITATANTWGLGGSLEFAGANKLDEAFLSRFEIKLPWDVDKQFERKIVNNNAWMDYVEAARQRVREAGLKYTIDSRAALAGATMISQLGYTFEQAADDTFLASLKNDQRKIIRGLAA